MYFFLNLTEKENAEGKHVGKVDIEFGLHILSRVDYPRNMFYSTLQVVLMVN